MSHQDQVNALIQDALIPIKEGIAKRAATKTTITYRRTAIVRRMDNCEPWNPRDGGGGGGFEREYQAFEVTKSPDEKLRGEIQFISLTKVTTTEEPL